MRKLTLNIKAFVYIFGSLGLFGLLIYRPYYIFNHHEIAKFNLLDNQIRRFSNNVYDDKDGDGANTSYFRLDSGCLCRKEYVEVNRISNAINSKSEQHYYDVNIKDLDGTYTIKYNLTRPQLEASFLTCDLYNSLRRGPNQRVISLTLFGTMTRRYLFNLKTLAKLAKKYYPEWVIRVYHDTTSASANRRCEYQCLRDENQLIYDNVDFCDVSEMPIDLHSTWSGNYIIPNLWRALPVIDSFVDLFIVRDMDNCITQREVLAVAEWINQAKYPFHIMRDHPSHSVSMIGGMWGYNNRLNETMSKEIFNALTDKYIADWYMSFRMKKGIEQQFIDRFIWPIARTNAKIHDSYWCLNFENGNRGDPFPSKRILKDDGELCFVGTPKCCGDDQGEESSQYVELTEHLRQHISNYICPVQCRPPNHQDWVYC